MHQPNRGLKKQRHRLVFVLKAERLSLMPVNGDQQTCPRRQLSGVSVCLTSENAGCRAPRGWPVVHWSPTTSLAVDWATWKPTTALRTPGGDRPWKRTAVSSRTRSRRKATRRPKRKTNNASEITKTKTRQPQSPLGSVRQSRSRSVGRQHCATGISERLVTPRARSAGVQQSVRKMELASSEDREKREERPPVLDSEWNGRLNLAKQILQCVQPLRKRPPTTLLERLNQLLDGNGLPSTESEEATWKERLQEQQQDRQYDEQRMTGKAELKRHEKTTKKRQRQEHHHPEHDEEPPSKIEHPLYPSRPELQRTIEESELNRLGETNDGRQERQNAAPERTAEKGWREEAIMESGGMEAAAGSETSAETLEQHQRMTESSGAGPSTEQFNTELLLATRELKAAVERSREQQALREQRRQLNPDCIPATMGTAVESVPTSTHAHQAPFELLCQRLTPIQQPVEQKEQRQHMESRLKRAGACGIPSAANPSGESGATTATVPSAPPQLQATTSCVETDIDNQDEVPERATRRLIVPPLHPFTGNRSSTDSADDRPFSNWIRSFEQEMMITRTDRTAWLTTLRYFLKDAAVDLYDSRFNCLPHDRRTYQGMVEVLKHTYDRCVTESEARRRLCYLNWNPKACTTDEFYVEVERIAASAYPEVEESARQRLVIRHFIDAFPPMIQRQIDERIDLSPVPTAIQNFQVLDWAREIMRREETYSECTRRYKLANGGGNGSTSANRRKAQGEIGNRQETPAKTSGDRGGRWRGGRRMWRGKERGGSGVCDGRTQNDFHWNRNRQRSKATSTNDKRPSGAHLTEPASTDRRLTALPLMAYASDGSRTSADRPSYAEESVQTMNHRSRSAKPTKQRWKHSSGGERRHLPPKGSQLPRRSQQQQKPRGVGGRDRMHRDVNGISCFNCHQVGHFARDCTQEPAICKNLIGRTVRTISAATRSERQQQPQRSDGQEMAERAREAQTTQTHMGTTVFNGEQKRKRRHRKKKPSPPSEDTTPAPQEQPSSEIQTPAPTEHEPAVKVETTPTPTEQRTAQKVAQMEEYRCSHEATQGKPSVAIGKWNCQSSEPFERQPTTDGTALLEQQPSSGESKKPAPTEHHPAAEMVKTPTPTERRAAHMVGQVCEYRCSHEATQGKPSVATSEWNHQGEWSRQSSEPIERQPTMDESAPIEQEPTSGEVEKPAPDEQQLVSEKKKKPTPTEHNSAVNMEKTPTPTEQRSAQMLAKVVEYRCSHEATQGKPLEANGGWSRHGPMPTELHSAPEKKKMSAPTEQQPTTERPASMEQRPAVEMDKMPTPKELQSASESEKEVSSPTEQQPTPETSETSAPDERQPTADASAPKEHQPTSGKRENSVLEERKPNRESRETSTPAERQATTVKPAPAVRRPAEKMHADVSDVSATLPATSDGKIVHQVGDYGRRNRRNSRRNRSLRQTSVLTAEKRQQRADGAPKEKPYLLSRMGCALRLYKDRGLTDLMISKPQEDGNSIVTLSGGGRDIIDIDRMVLDERRYLQKKNEHLHRKRKGNSEWKPPPERQREDAANVITLQPRTSGCKHRRLADVPSKMDAGMQSMAVHEEESADRVVSRQNRNTAQLVERTDGYDWLEGRNEADVHQDVHPDDLQVELDMEFASQSPWKGENGISDWVTRVPDREHADLPQLLSSDDRKSLEGSNYTLWLDRTATTEAALGIGDSSESRKDRKYAEMVGILPRTAFTEEKPERRTLPGHQHTAADDQTRQTAAPHRRPAETTNDEARKAINATGKSTTASSPWKSTIAPVGKENGLMRIAVDYRKLTGGMNSSHRPPSGREELIGSNGNGRQRKATIMEMAQNFPQKSTADREAEQTSTLCHDGDSKDSRSPMGLENSPPSQHRHRSNILEGVERINTKDIEPKCKRQEKLTHLGLEISNDDGRRPIAFRSNDGWNDRPPAMTKPVCRQRNEPLETKTGRIAMGGKVLLELFSSGDCVVARSPRAGPPVMPLECKPTQVESSRAEWGTSNNDEKRTPEMNGSSSERLTDEWIGESPEVVNSNGRQQISTAAAETAADTVIRASDDDKSEEVGLKESEKDVKERLRERQLREGQPGLKAMAMMVENYRLQDGVLTVGTDMKSSFRLCVPQMERKATIERRRQQSDIGAHLEVEEVTTATAVGDDRPRMQAPIEQHRQECRMGLEQRRGAPGHQPPHAPIEAEQQQPPTTGNGDRKVPGIVDLFAAYLIDVPMENDGAMTVARESHEHRSTHFTGSKRLLRGDTMMNFNSDVINELKKRDGGEHHSTMMSIPHSNQQTGSADSTTMQMLAKTTQDHPGDWKERSPDVFSTQTTAISPHFLELERNPAAVLHLVVDWPTFDERQRDDNHTSSFDRRQVEASIIASVIQPATQQRQKRLHDGNVKMTAMVLGERVMVYRPILTTELSKPKYDGVLEDHNLVKLCRSPPAAQLKENNQRRNPRRCQKGEKTNLQSANQIAKVKTLGDGEVELLTSSDISTGSEHEDSTGRGQQPSAERRDPTEAAELELESFYDLAFRFETAACRAHEAPDSSLGLVKEEVIVEEPPESGPEDAKLADFQQDQPKIEGTAQEASENNGGMEILMLQGKCNPQDSSRSVHGDECTCVYDGQQAHELKFDLADQEKTSTLSETPETPHKRRIETADGEDLTDGDISKSGDEETDGEQRPLGVRHSKWSPEGPPKQLTANPDVVRMEEGMKEPAMTQRSPAVVNQPPKPPAEGVCFVESEWPMCLQPAAATETQDRMEIQMGTERLANGSRTTDVQDVTPAEFDQTAAQTTATATCFPTPECSLEGAGASWILADSDGNGQLSKREQPLSTTTASTTDNANRRALQETSGEVSSAKLPSDIERADRLHALRQVDSSAMFITGEKAGINGADWMLKREKDDERQLLPPNATAMQEVPADGPLSGESPNEPLARKMSGHEEMTLMHDWTSNDDVNRMERHRAGTGRRAPKIIEQQRPAETMTDVAASQQHPTAAQADDVADGRWGMDSPPALQRCRKAEKERQQWVQKCYERQKGLAEKQNGAMSAESSELETARATSAAANKWSDDDPPELQELQMVEIEGQLKVKESHDRLESRADESAGVVMRRMEEDADFNDVFGLALGGNMPESILTALEDDSCDVQLMPGPEEDSEAEATNDTERRVRDALEHLAAARNAHKRRIRSLLSKACQLAGAGQNPEEPEEHRNAAKLLQACNYDRDRGGNQLTAAETTLRSNDQWLKKGAFGYAISRRQDQATGKLVYFEPVQKGTLEEIYNDYRAWQPTPSGGDRRCTQFHASTPAAAFTIETEDSTGRKQQPSAEYRAPIEATEQELDNFFD